MSGYASYLRVSTDKQGKSGLGLEAQRQMVSNFVQGLDGEVEQEFVEVASGRSARRQELDKALRYCKRNKCTLLVGKLDRLSRNVHFISGLMEARVRFIAVEMPNASEFELNIRASLAQEERRMISERTRAAMAVARERGVKLGNPRIHELVKANQAPAQEFARQLRPLLQRMQTAGMRQRRMVEELTFKQIPTRNGGKWSLMQLQRVLKYMKVRRPDARVPPMTDSRLRQLRVERGLSMRKLEELSGVPKSIISHAENLKFNLKGERAAQLAKVLGCEPTELLF